MLVTEIFFSAKTSSWGLKTQTKNLGGGGVFFPTKFFCSKMFLVFFSEGGGFWGVWGAPRPHPGVTRGRKTIHFFL